VPRAGRSARRPTGHTPITRSVDSTRAEAGTARRTAAGL